MLAENAPQHFDAIAQRLAGPWTPALEALKKPAQQSVRDNFNSQASPEGKDWPPRKHEGDGHPLLADTGTMMQAATGGGAGSVARVEDDVLSIGVNLDTVPYARRHNLGDVPGSRDSLGRRMNMPERRYLGMTEERKQEGAKIVGDIGEAELFGRK